MNHKLVKANILKRGDIIFTAFHNIFDIVVDVKQLTQYTNRYKIILGRKVDNEIYSNYDILSDLLIEKLQDGLYKI